MGGADTDAVPAALGTAPTLLEAVGRAVVAPFEGVIDMPPLPGATEGVVMPPLVGEPLEGGPDGEGGGFAPGVEGAAGC